MPVRVGDYGPQVQGPSRSQRACVVAQPDGDSSAVVTVATFNKPEEAHLLRMRLEAGGIPAYIQDENFIQIDQLLANAIGGVRVQIADEDIDAAKELLAQDSRDAEEQKPTLQCPKCHSTHVVRESFSRRLAFFSILLLGFPLLWLRRGLRCEECLYSWKPDSRS